MTNILNLPGVIVENKKQTGETLILAVISENKTAFCPRYGQASHRIHQNQGIMVRDLPISNQEVILRVNRRRFKCENCQKPFSETLNFVETKKHSSRRYAESITKQVIHSDISNVAKNNKLTEDLVGSMVKYVA
ncbi:transposase family protein [Microcoleus sp. S13_C5]|uniref:transposase family protein n=1 Tax=Microcoleus sp. S13_C5 TaxID=3055411 RepID=UPI002FD60CB0